MLGERLRELREIKTLSLSEVARRVNRHTSTISRYESNKVERWDPGLVEELANVLNTTPAYLLGITDDIDSSLNYDIEEYQSEGILQKVLITDDEMSPEFPYGAIVKIRRIESNEKLQIGSYYHIEFNDKKCFRMAVEDHENGIGFLPNDMSERRIAYDHDYVKIIGKAVEMKVFFDDEIQYG